MLKNKFPIFLIMLTLLFVGCEPKPSALAEDNNVASTEDAKIFPGYGDLIRPTSDHDFQDVEVDIQLLADHLMWRDFIALNWPASQDPNYRGVPDLGNVIGGLRKGGVSPDVQPNGPTVWETFKSTNDVFLSNPYEVPDTSFNAVPVVPAACSGLDGKALARRTKISDVVSKTNQAFSNAPLIDQNGNTVWYEVMYNKTAFEYVIDNEFYNKKKQKGATISFPVGNNETTEVGAMRVKAAWKVFDWSTESDKAEYFYLSKGYVYNTTTGNCDTATLALVGMHIVHKLKSRPEWVWGTFEHMYNCPDTTGWPELPSGWDKYSFNDPSKPGPYNVKPDSGSSTPVQVQRTTPIPDQVRQINESYQNLLTQLRSNSVWQYYMLVDAQWPTAPEDTAKYGDPRPDYLANSVIETYLQGPTTDSATPRSCMGCHGMYALKTDFGFQLQVASSPADQLNSPNPTFFSNKEEATDTIYTNEEEVVAIQEFIEKTSDED